MNNVSNWYEKKSANWFEYPKEHFALVGFFQSVRYENGTDGYDNLVNPSSPTYTYFYFFNLTNAEEYEMTGATPIVEEIGPYVYR